MDKEYWLADQADVSQDDWLRQLFGDAAVPARKIRPSRVAVTGFVSTEKGENPQDAESSLEQDFLNLLEYDRRVVRYVAQPFTIVWKDATGRRRRYTPDVAVKYSTFAEMDDPHIRTTIFEVKYRKDLRENWAELKPAFRAAIGWARQRGCRFNIVTDKEIRTPYLTNAVFLLNYTNQKLAGHQAQSGASQLLIAQTLIRLGRTTPRELLAAMSAVLQQQAELLPWVWNLINLDVVGADLTEKITMTSPIWPTDKTVQLIRVNS